MANPFKVGDIITPNKSYVKQWPKCLTYGKAYTVAEVTSRWVRFICDDGATGGWSYDNFTLVVTTSPAYVSQYTNNPYDDTFEGEEITGEPEAYKHAYRVCSLGKFKQGDRLVYKDATPINIDGGVFTVSTCSASMVTFEHCYSWPFNPDEFCTEDS